MPIEFLYMVVIFAIVVFVLSVRFEGKNFDYLYKQVFELPSKFNVGDIVIHKRHAIPFVILSKRRRKDTFYYTCESLDGTYLSEFLEIELNISTKFTDDRIIADWIE